MNIVVGAGGVLLINPKSTVHRVCKDAEATEYSYFNMDAIYNSNFRASQVLTSAHRLIAQQVS